MGKMGPTLACILLKLQPDRTFYDGSCGVPSKGTPNPSLIYLKISKRRVNNNAVVLILTF